MEKIYDVAVIGGGIAGLSASICASTEGFSTVVLDGNTKYGGQAGTASLIENLIGFPHGISGVELTSNSIEQANKFGVHFKSPFKVVRVEKDELNWKLYSEDEDVVTAKTIVLAMGQSYKKIETCEIDRFLGLGVYYGSPLLSEDFKNKTISIVGGANSAGQAAVYLSQCEGCNVNLIIRGESIESSMSHYLYQKIYNIPNIKVFTNAQILRGNGVCKLESLTLETPDGEFDIISEELFILIGSKPKTKWLGEIVKMDADGFIVTDDDLKAGEGIFCVGDVRSTSIKRVSCAVGEGGRVIRGIRARIKETSSI